MPIVDSAEWSLFLKAHPDAHLLQTAPWGDLKASFGWDPVRVVHGDAGAQLLFRQLPLGYSLAYVPKGPVGEGWQALWGEVDGICRTRRAVFLKAEPDRSPAELSSAVSSPPAGFRPSSHGIQPQRTLIVDLTGSEEEILGRMKQKTRYNIRLAGRKDVVVQPSSDVLTFNALLQATGEREEFGVHHPDYYRKAYALFHPPGQCELFLATYQGEPLAGLMAFAHGRRSWYFYGASRDRHRNRMPTYLLQWEAMRWAKRQGCETYDLWGVPDEEETVLEESFTERSDGLWGVYRFKRGFGGELHRTAGSWDRVFRPGLYALYQWWADRRAPVD